mgnify:CR=1 FL=1
MSENPSVAEQISRRYHVASSNVELHPELMSLYGLNPFIRQFHIKRPDLNRDKTRIYRIQAVRPDTQTR